MSTFILKQKSSILSMAAVVASVTLFVAITPKADATSTSSGPGFAQAAAVGPKDAHQWDLSEAGMPKINQPYKLINKRTDGVLGYQKRWPGINLGWVGRSGPGQWTFHRENATDTQPVREGESVALRNTKGGYVYYGERRFGINVNWSSKPRFEWRVSKSGALFSLHNEVTHDYLVYGRRAVGVNLCWLQDIKVDPISGKDACVPH